MERDCHLPRHPKNNDIGRLVIKGKAKDIAIVDADAAGIKALNQRLFMLPVGLLCWLLNGLLQNRKLKQ